MPGRKIVKQEINLCLHDDTIQYVRKKSGEDRKKLEELMWSTFFCEGRFSLHLESNN